MNPFQSDTDAAINAYNAKAAKNVALYEAYNADTTAARLTELDTTAEGMIATLRPASPNLVAARLADTERQLSRGE